MQDREEIVKACSDCREIKPLFEFRKHKNRIHGHSYLCKRCDDKAQSKSYYKNKEKRRKSKAKLNRERRKKNPDGIKMEDKVRHKKYRNRRLAGSRLHDAVQRGELVKPSYCEFCFKEGEVQAHHQDYNKPLDVKWLCSNCHVDWHRWMRFFNLSKQFIILKREEVEK